MKRYPEQVAVVFHGQKWTFRQLNVRANRLANALLDLGLTRGDRVGILLPNRPEIIEFQFAAAKCGIIRVPLNARLAPREWHFMIQDSGMSALILNHDFYERLTEYLPRMSAPQHLVFVGEPPAGHPGYEEFISRASETDPRVPVNEEDICAIGYTSGTTGMMKGVMWTYRSRVAANTHAMAELIQPREGDAMLHVCPLTHASGLYVMPHYIRGARNVILERFDVESFLETVEQERITATWVVPTILRRLVDDPGTSKYDLSSLHTVIFGGSPITVDTLLKAYRLLGPRLVQIYGLFEANTPVLVTRVESMVDENPSPDNPRLLAAGRGIINVALRLVDENGHDVPLGQVGELVVRGPNVMTGYWNNPEETARVLRDGWLHTGDMAQEDEKGFFYLVERKKDMIISGGFNIYSREVEEALCSHPAVVESAVIGVPDPEWGESVKAFVVLKEGHRVTPDELISHCAGLVAGYKKPRSIEIVPELCRNPTGKLDKKRLREPYWKGRKRRIN
ncbi:MAG: long-chain-fatty-acid--CoA ligase [Deltaproteobacteria bacterium]|nr:long-chain-fatty-acid--CoA ligase [Deltaproteobacteria bacterium]